MQLKEMCILVFVSDQVNNIIYLCNLQARICIIFPFFFNFNNFIECAFYQVLIHFNDGFVYVILYVHSCVYKCVRVSKLGGLGRVYQVWIWRSFD